ncbi:Uncharacterised protein [Chlamydia trachomatis]|nr:Uncharacterised protein [Chlamydia trachomatis]
MKNARRARLKYHAYHQSSQSLFAKYRKAVQLNKLAYRRISSYLLELQTRCEYLKQIEAELPHLQFEKLEHRSYLAYLFPYHRRHSH